MALNRSHLANGLSQHLESLPTPHLAVTLNTISPNSRENGMYGRAEVLVIDGEGLGCGGRLEEPGKCTDDDSERKAERSFIADFP